MAPTYPFFMSMVPGFALLQWFAKISNFWFLTKKFRGQTKLLTAILGCWGIWIFGLWLAVARQEGLLDPQRVPKWPSDNNLNCQTIILDIVYKKYENKAFFKRSGGIPPQTSGPSEGQMLQVWTGKYNQK